jgi:hypothetical protein
MELPIVCNRSELSREEQERQRLFLRDLLASALEKRPLPNGLFLRFPAESLSKVAELIAIERCCCPFLDVHLEAKASEPWVALTLEGPPGTREVLEVELQLLS